MQFMFLVKANVHSESGQMPSAELMAAVDASAQELTKAGIMISAGGLRPSAEGARVVLHHGTISVTDGPFSETKELVGGWAIMELESRDQAIQYAKDFVELHRKFLGDDYGFETEVRRMYGPEDFAPQS